jgi:ABC-type phosphate transport system substrate-binding protein
MEVKQGIFMHKHVSAVALSFLAAVLGLSGCAGSTPAASSASLASTSQTGSSSSSSSEDPLSEHFLDYAERDIAGAEISYADQTIDDATAILLFNAWTGDWQECFS